MSEINKIDLVERAKMYLKLLNEGIHPVTGAQIPADSALVDGKVKRCFEFINGILDEYVELAERVEKLEADKEKKVIVIPKKQEFTITREQCDSIKLSKEPLTVMSFMKNINSVIDDSTTEKLTSTRINKWLSKKGLITSTKVATVVNRTVSKPSDFAVRIGIFEEDVVDKKSGEVKTQLKLGETAQLFIIENIEEIIAST